MPARKPLVLLILDGWGHLETKQYNAIALANTPQWDSWLKHYPHALLEASGEAVGLPENQMGNSEVGHMHIGAGRLVRQDLSQIDHDITSGVFFNHPKLVSLCLDSQKNNRTLHVIGLLSPGGVHSHQSHLFAFLKLASLHGAPTIALHLFLDGRDVPPQSAIPSLEALNQELKQYPFASIASLCGRFYAMDRDRRFERLQETYDLVTRGNKPHFKTATDAIMASYQKNIFDEFIPPCVIGEEPKLIKDHDNVFFFNFRADRAIQLTEALTETNDEGVVRYTFPKIHQFLTMTPYSKHLAHLAVYPARQLENTLGEVLAKHHLKQLRLAETEKFPHVTYFFNGGQESSFPQEERILIPSPKVKTYDLEPQMRAHEITDVIIDALNKDQYDVIIANFANADMVGHCGELKPTIAAIETLDQCFQKINQALVKKDALAIITADHGNAEIMYDDQNKQKHTAHTLSLVPFLFVGKNCQLTRNHGSLLDIAPTILYALNIKKPKEMSGNSLIKRIIDEK